MMLWVYITVCLEERTLCMKAKHALGVRLLTLSVDVYLSLQLLHAYPITTYILQSCGYGSLLDSTKQTHTHTHTEAKLFVPLVIIV
jgi:hypothetical protein